MNERLLQYIWQFSFYNTRNMITTIGQPVEVISPGMLNKNQGPDFLNGKIRYDGKVWAGNIELHINSSDWKAHGHSDDANYNNVILHVVWNNDADISLPFPCVELQSRISSVLLNRYRDLMQNPTVIPCAQQIKHVSAIVFTAWKERLLIERLQKKAAQIKIALNKSNNHWEEVFWWAIAKNFGMRVNGDSFEKIAQTIPLNVLGRHKNQIHQLEAILMGQAGILDKKFNDHYPNMLRREYNFLRGKYGLPKVHYPLFYLRMRPANFPTVRLAQLAALINESHHLFSFSREAEDVQSVIRSLNVTANDYWDYHYVPDEETSFKKKTLGKQMAENIVTNTIIVMLFAYGHINRKQKYIDKALRWMSELPAEHNNITKEFENAGIINASSYDSQSFIQLYNFYCTERRCLECSVGNAILKS